MSVLKGYGFSRAFAGEEIRFFRCPSIYGAELQLSIQAALSIIRAGFSRWHNTIHWLQQKLNSLSLRQRKTHSIAHNKCHDAPYHDIPGKWKLSKPPQVNIEQKANQHSG